MLAGSALRAAPVRTLKICVALDAEERVRRAARSILDRAGTHRLLKALGGPGTLVDTRGLAAAPQPERAYSHLVVVGAPGDPLLRAAWQREAREEPGGFFLFGFGHLRGDIGYVESDRNPFLHSASIPTAPFETEVIAITGSNAAGIEFAAKAFLDRELINGVVAGAGWSRAGKTLLDHDPLAPEFQIPVWVPEQLGSFVRIGVTQASEDEYRGVLADTQVEPAEIWRVKYFRPGGWDGAGSAGAFEDYAAGLHRRSYEYTLWLARFGSSKEANDAAPKIAAAAKLKRQDGQWTGAQPPYANNTYPGEKASPGALDIDAT